MNRLWLKIIGSTAIASLAFSVSCKSGRSGGIDILGPVDETAEAAKLVAEANQDLTKIKILYKENEGRDEQLGKREQLKKALEANDAELVKKISGEVVSLINEGADFGKTAVEKIQTAQDMQVNEDYREYLRLKEYALKRQLEAFENYKLAALSLRDNYDPKNTQLRDKVKEEFKTRSENYQKIMEKARDYSNQANELAKGVLRKKQN